MGILRELREGVAHRGRRVDVQVGQRVDRLHRLVLPVVPLDGDEPLGELDEAEALEAAGAAGARLAGAAGAAHARVPAVQREAQQPALLLRAPADHAAHDGGGGEDEEEPHPEGVVLVVVAVLLLHRVAVAVVPAVLGGVAENVVDAEVADAVVGALVADVLRHADAVHLRARQEEIDVQPPHRLGGGGGGLRRHPPDEEVPEGRPLPLLQLLRVVPGPGGGGDEEAVAARVQPQGPRVDDAVLRQVGRVVLVDHQHLQIRRLLRPRDLVEVGAGLHEGGVQPADVGGGGVEHREVQPLVPRLRVHRQRDPLRAHVGGLAELVGGEDDVAVHRHVAVVVDVAAHHRPGVGGAAIGGEEVRVGHVQRPRLRVRHQVVRAEVVGEGVGLGDDDEGEDDVPPLAVAVRVAVAVAVRVRPRGAGEVAALHLALPRVRREAHRGDHALGGHHVAARVQPAPRVAHPQHLVELELVVREPVDLVVLELGGADVRQLEQGVRVKLADLPRPPHEERRVHHRHAEGPLAEPEVLLEEGALRGDHGYEARLGPLLLQRPLVDEVLVVHGVVHDRVGRAHELRVGHLHHHLRRPLLAGDEGVEVDAALHVEVEGVVEVLREGGDEQLVAQRVEPERPRVDEAVLRQVAHPRGVAPPHVQHVGDALLLLVLAGLVDLQHLDHVGVVVGVLDAEDVALVGGVVEEREVQGLVRVEVDALRKAVQVLREGDGGGR
mmetsp:Transcript_4971/g.10176  ORF Transcript_4971/g.10176 Transcript_4971/m.10176 type:complete len:722 (-) Transcript_4971:2570-4735(-)